MLPNPSLVRMGMLLQMQMSLPKFANQILAVVLPGLDKYKGDDPVRIVPFNTINYS
jgi:hypothetical protein